MVRSKVKPKSREVTTIKLYRPTKLSLDKLRVYPKEPYNSIIQRLLTFLGGMRI